MVEVCHNVGLCEGVWCGVGGILMDRDKHRLLQAQPGQVRHAPGSERINQISTRPKLIVPYINPGLWISDPDPAAFLNADLDPSAFFVRIRIQL